MSSKGPQDAAVNEGAPLTGSTSNGAYGSAEDGAASNQPTALKDILRKAPSDLRGSMQSIRDLIEEHTGKIGYLGSYAIACNSLTGPAMLHLPATFHRSGLIPTLFVLIFVCILAALCSLHMANTISKVPGNSNFKEEVEYAEVFRFFWGERAYMLAQLLFFLCISCLNISSIVDTAQTVDTALGNYAGSVALQISWDPEEDTLSWIHWVASECSQEVKIAGDCLPYVDDGEDSSVILTAGYMIVVVIFLPMALMDLKENALWQIVGFIVSILASFQFAIAFIMEGLDFSSQSLWGESWSALFGVILFNFALVIAIPAWLYEKEDSVDAANVINGSSVLSVVLYILVGALGSMAMPNVSENMLESMESGAHGVSLQIGASIFAFFIIGLGIPLFSVLTRYGLVGSNQFSTKVANMLAVYFPFGVGWMLYEGQGITNLLSWGGVICTSLVAFILPLLVALHTVEENEHEGFVSVYGIYLSCFPSLEHDKGAQIRVLKVLLALAVLSIIAAIIGNIEGDA
ncbi:expressed unknown protein [Seminavis robusta]|uniref:Amino acid transporter transmembrane domain-containing protein n=1 Tax=Seminavis robusta TaxID=568900 RepID=A0A9N8DF67_9STRA|nr:expressed unknown protein [Seminavis robusta]|eukprot:Sro41_g025030.1 n/a (518) ;mRNA; r:8554-10393